MLDVTKAVGSIGLVLSEIKHVVTVGLIQSEKTRSRIVLEASLYRIQVLASFVR